MTPSSFGDLLGPEPDRPDAIDFYLAAALAGVEPRTILGAESVVQSQHTAESAYPLLADGVDRVATWLTWKITENLLRKSPDVIPPDWLQGGEEG